MKKFDLKKYKQPDINDIDLPKTRKNVKLFLDTYQTNKLRVQIKNVNGQSLGELYKELTDETYGLSESLVIIRREFLALHELFVKGMANIQHPNPSKTERRKQMFMLRYIKGLTVDVVSQQTYFCVETVKAECDAAVVQFAHAIGVVEYKE